MISLKFAAKNGVVCSANRPVVVKVGREGWREGGRGEWKKGGGTNRADRQGSRRRRAKEGRRFRIGGENVQVEGRGQGKWWYLPEKRVAAEEKIADWPNQKH